MGDVVSVNVVIVETKFAAQESAGQLSDQFLSAVGLIAKLLAEGAIKPFLSACPMAKLVKRGCVVALGAIERFECWQVHIVADRPIVGARFAMTHIGAR